jgi:hypothetical protein
MLCVGSKCFTERRMTSILSYAAASMKLRSSPGLLKCDGRKGHARVALRLGQEETALFVRNRQAEFFHHREHIFPDLALHIDAAAAL